MGLIGENIRKYRIERNITQKELAERLYVTAQAVSRWENNEVEPSINTIIMLAEIFEVSVDELCGKEKPTVEPVVVNNYVYDIVRLSGRGHNKVYCRSCYNMQQESLQQQAVNRGKSRFIKSFWIAGIIAAVWLIIALVILIPDKNVTGILVNVFISLGIFTCVACIVLSNNFIGDMILSIIEWGFVKMPGVIFELSLDGLLWLITVKLLLWIIQISISILVSIFAIILGCTLSLIVYPFALIKNIRHPELSN